MLPDVPDDRVLTDRSMPGAVWFPGTTINFAEQALPARHRRAPRADRRRRGHRAGRDLLGVAARPGRRVRRDAAPARRAAGRPGRRLPAQRARGGRRLPRRGVDRRGLVLLRARLRHPRRPRPVRPDRAHRAGRRRRLPVQRQGVRPPGRRRRAARRACRPCGRRSPSPGCSPTRCPTARWPGPTRSPTSRSRSSRALPFDHPLWIVYSSGTTGLPKGIVHGHGGVVLEQRKQAALHMDVGAGDRFFWYASTAWIMWNIADVGAADRRHGRRLRRRTDLSDGRRPVRPRRPHRHDLPRHQPRLPRRLREGRASGRASSTTSPRCGRSASPARRCRRPPSAGSTTR